MRETPDYLFAYGLLQQGQPGFITLGLSTALRYLGDDEVSGTLYDLGAYPGVTLGGKDKIHGTVYKIIRHDIIPTLDKYEDYFPDRLSASMYVRETVLTTGRGLHAWVYRYNQSLVGKKRVQSGRWKS